MYINKNKAFSLMEVIVSVFILILVLIPSVKLNIQQIKTYSKIRNADSELHFFTSLNNYLKAENIIKMMNPMNYIDNNTPTKYWRIRHGAIDKDTSLAIPAILALKLKNSGKIVNFAVPWGQGHGGDYDLEALFNWIDSVVKNNF